MEIQSATPRYDFASATGLALEAVFDGGRLTSDGGLPWLAEADQALELCAALAAALPERRRRHVRYSLEGLVRQRVFQIACGYEDQNDATTLRDDPLLKVVCGQFPESGPALAGQSTFSRLENAVDRHACRQLAHVLLEVYLAAREQDGVPSHILLDLDSTDDPTHGKQEGTAYHGSYRQHMYYPLLVFDGETDHLITALLRPGTVHGRCGIIPVLRVLVRAIRQRWPGVPVEIRADCGCATPRLYRFCERHQIGYTLGLGSNPRLAALAAPLREAAIAQRVASGEEKVRLCSETTYQAESWDHPRRVVYKAEALAKGPNVRFVVTTRTAAPADLYEWYVDRGAAEL